MMILMMMMVMRWKARMELVSTSFKISFNSAIWFSASSRRPPVGTDVISTEAVAEVGAVSVVGSLVVSIVVDRGVVSILVVVREIFSSVVVRGDIDVVGMAGHITSAPASESSLRDSFYFQTVIYSSNSSFRSFTLY